MQKKDIDWSSLGFGYVKTDKRFVAHYKNGKWDEGQLVEDDTITLNECAGVLQYAQTCFEGLKAYTTKDGRTVCFRPDLNASRIADSCRGLQIPVVPEEMFLRAVKEVVKANEAWVPPFAAVLLFIFVRMFLALILLSVLNLQMSMSLECSVLR